MRICIYILDLAVVKLDPIRAVRINTHNNALEVFTHAFLQSPPPLLTPSRPIPPSNRLLSLPDPPFPQRFNSVPNFPLYPPPRSRICVFPSCFLLLSLRPAAYLIDAHLLKAVLRILSVSLSHTRTLTHSLTHTHTHNQTHTHNTRSHKTHTHTLNQSIKCETTEATCEVVGASTSASSVLLVTPRTPALVLGQYVTTSPTFTTPTPKTKAALHSRSPLWKKKSEATRRVW